MKNMNLISKIHNYIKRRSQKEKEFWGPVWMILGASTLTNSYNVSLVQPFISFIYIAGAFFVIMGFWQTMTLPKDQRLMSRLMITIGYTFFLFGIRFRSCNLMIGNIITIVFFIVVILGLLFSFNNKSQNKTNKLKQKEN